MNRSRERTFKEIIVAVELGVQVTVDQGQDLELAQIEIG